MANMLTASSKFERDVYSKFDFYRHHPVHGAIDLLELDVPPVQRIMLRSTFDVSSAIYTASRGVGKTFIAAAQALLTAILFNKSRVLLIGPTFRHGKLIFTEMERILNNSPRAQIWLKKDPVHQSDIWKCDFINGSVIATMPLASESESSIRGFRAHRIQCDEAPHVPEDTFNLVLTPMLSTVREPMKNVRRMEKLRQMLEKGQIQKEDIKFADSNKLFLFTSAYYQFNHVYKQIVEFEKMRQEKLQAKLSPQTQTFYFSYMDAPEGFIDMERLEISRRTMPDFQFRMEWLAEWQPDSNGFYPRKLIDACTGKFNSEIRGTRDSIYFMGIDPARTADNFAISIGKYESGAFKLVRVIAYNNKPFDSFILKEFRQLLRDFPNIQRIYMDDGGGGLHFKDLIAGTGYAQSDKEIILDGDDENHRGRRGRKILKMVHFNPELSRDFNYAMKSEMERGGVLFPFMVPAGSMYIKPIADVTDIKDLMNTEAYTMSLEMQSIQVTTTAGGNLRFDGPTKSSKTDRFTSTLLCFSAHRDMMLREPVHAELPGGNWADQFDDEETEDQEISSLSDTDGIVIEADHQQPLMEWGGS